MCSISLCGALTSLPDLVLLEGLVSTLRGSELLFISSWLSSGSSMLVMSNLAWGECSNFSPVVRKCFLFLQYTIPFSDLT